MDFRSRPIWLGWTWLPPLRVRPGGCHPTSARPVTTATAICKAPSLKGFKEAASNAFKAWSCFVKDGWIFQQIFQQYVVHPGRLTWNIIMEVWFRSFSFLNGWFVGSMLIFQGVVRDGLSHYLQKIEIEISVSLGFSACFGCYLKHPNQNTYDTPTKFNSSPLKNDDWRTILSFWRQPIFRGKLAVKLPGSSIVDSHHLKQMFFF